jgi:PAS domain-containing protein
MNINASPLVNKHTSEFAADITERKKSEQLLLHQAYYINNVSDAIIASDKNFLITFWNKAAGKIYGWKAEEAIGKKGTELLRTEFVSISREQALKLVEELGSYKLDIPDTADVRTELVKSLGVKAYACQLLYHKTYRPQSIH